MQKDDWPPLLSPGMAPMTLAQLAEMTLSPFPASDRRKELVARLHVFLLRAGEFGVFVEAWFDGSFLTEKPDPDDIDLVLFGLPDIAQALSHEQQQTLSVLLDRTVAKERYGLDLFIERTGDFNRRAYWRGVFGFAHDEITAKGIAVVELKNE